MLLFFDIDGTLVTNENPFLIPESAVRAINMATENGHICMINTGRTMKLVDKSLTDQARFAGIAAGCGTYLLLYGKEYLHRSFTAEEGQRIIEGIRRHRFDACLEGKDNNYLDTGAFIIDEGFHEKMNRFGKGSYGTFEESVGRFDKFYCYAAERERIAAFQKEFADMLEFVDREHGYYEVNPIGYSKASIVEKTAEILKIPMEETVAIGDSNNDMPMLKRAHTAIVMGNATGDVKSAADYVTTRVEEDGIWNALRWLGII